MSRYDICVIGLGYIGLPTASIFANNGKRVLGVDLVPRVVDTINRGEIHIVEPDLHLLVSAGVKSGNLRAALEVAPAEAFVIAVPTPFHTAPDGRRTPDVSYVESATRSLGGVVEAGNIVILESTSPVGTTELVRDWLADELVKRGRSIEVSAIHFAHCPERVLPGQMLKELVSNDRVAGGLTAQASQHAKDLYAVFCKGEIFISDARTAEMAKLTENAFRDVNIAFANELSMICEKLNIDVWELITLANRHPRVKILQPGPGVGGHCIAVDPWFIVNSAPEEARLIATAREVNDSKPHHVVRRVKEAAAGKDRPVVACLGLAFKANVDDLRESPAVDIATEIARDPQFGRVLAVEPNIRELPASLRKTGIELTGLQEAIEAASVVVLLVDHKGFSILNRTMLASKVVIDTRGVLHRVKH